MTGAEIRAFRERYGLSQTGLARLLNVTDTTVARWERNERKPEGYFPLALERVEQQLKRQQRRESE